MNWSMPRPVLQVVAVLLGAAVIGAFVMGVATAPTRGRLPGERPDGATGEVLQAQDATPFTEERIEGAAAPQLSDEEKARLDEEREAKEEAAAAAKAAALTPVAPPVAPAQLVAPSDKIGEALEKPPGQPKPAAQPKYEEPPF